MYVTSNNIPWQTSVAQIEVDNSEIYFIQVALKELSMT